MTTILKRTLRNVVTLASVAAIALGLTLQAQTPYGFAITDGGGRLTDFGCYLLFLAIMGTLAAMLPLARWVDDNGYWRG